MDLDELLIGAGPFSPAQEPFRTQLLVKLGMQFNTHVEEMEGFGSGLKEGIWLARGTTQEHTLVLKLVSCDRITANIPTEAENCIKIHREHPGVATDSTIAFPFKIFSCVGLDGAKRYDLLVMKKVRGTCLAELIAEKWHGNQIPQLCQIMERLGERLAEFHASYGNSQHGNLEPSNIFYDEVTDTVSFIDLVGMGIQIMENDVEHFSKSIRFLGQEYGIRLTIQGVCHFKQGYSAKAAPREN